MPWRTKPLPAAGEALVDPDLPVAFYRKSALDLAGPFLAQVGDRLACVDAGLTLEQLGYRSLVQPRCQVQGRRDARAVVEPPLRRGWAEERMFWRWLPKTGSLRSLPAHALLLAWESMQTVVRPSNFLRLLGRRDGCSAAAASRSALAGRGAIAPREPAAAGRAQAVALGSPLPPRRRAPFSSPHRRSRRIACQPIRVAEQSGGIGTSVRELATDEPSAALGRNQTIADYPQTRERKRGVATD